MYWYAHKSHGTAKLDDRAVDGILLGSVDGMYKVCTPKTKTVTATKHVSIDEAEFPMHKREPS